MGKSGKHKGGTPLLDKLLFWKKKPAASHVGQISTAESQLLDAKKQAELEVLCNALFQKKELITSGKLQFVGLAKVKQHMGRQWPGLCRIVYETAEEVIKAHLDKGDLSIRYKDDTYVLIFARSSLAEGQAKATTIVEEIRRKLLTLDRPELQDIELRKAIAEIATGALIGRDLPGIASAIAEHETLDTPVKKIHIEAIKVETPSGRIAASTPAIRTAQPEAYRYVPLWDAQKGALTTYLCLATQASGANFEYYQTLFRHKAIAEKLALDSTMLDTVSAELQNMEREDRRLLVACPVQYETLFNPETHAAYKRRLEGISAERRKLLKLFIMDVPEALPAHNPFWFSAPIRSLCRNMSLETPLRHDADFQQMQRAGITAAGVRLHRHAGLAEHDIIALMNGFGAKAKAFKMARTFVLDVSSLSLTTSAVCAGFDFLGGSAIHDAVAKPDHVYRYQHADLLNACAR